MSAPQFHQAKESRNNIVRAGFEISDLYPQNAGIFTYGVGLLSHLKTVDNRIQVTLLDGLGRRNLTEFSRSTGLRVDELEILRATRTNSPTGLLLFDHTTSVSSHVHGTLDEYFLKALWWWARRSPATVKWALRPSVMRTLDVCHWSHTLFLPYPQIPSVITVHDAIPITCPDFVTPGHTRAEWDRLNLINRYATRVIADSESTKRDVMNLVGIEEERIDVIPLAAGEAFRPPTDRVAQDAVLARYGLQRDAYVLCVGTIEPRKNLVRLAQAFQAVIERQPSLSTRLVLAGRTGWLTEEIDAGIAALGLGDRLVMPGRVPQDELPALLNGARVGVYVSLYEGFGLPPLEAMASGAAVIASNTTSLPEVVGDGGILVNPLAVGEIATAIERVLLDDALHAELVERGLRQAGRFSWTRTAELTMDTYRRAVS